ncbi:MAG: T9SS C-terminal target domain-containing protein, partial [Calditrichaeota bacterium]
QDPSWAVFRFPNNQVQKFDRISIITDNGTDDDVYQVRQVQKIDIYTSTTGLEDKDFQLVKKIRVKSAEKTEVNLGYLVEAKYVKLILPTTFASQGWRQLVEFSVQNSGKNGESLPKSESTPAAPAEFRLAQNYPNPFNPATHIQYALAQDGPVTLTIYDVTGRVVTELVNEQQTAGEYEITWNAENAASGLYFYQIVAGSFRETKRMLLIR